VASPLSALFLSRPRPTHPSLGAFGGGPGGGAGGGGGGPGGGPGGVPGGPKRDFIKIYEDPKRPQNSGFWIRMTPRDDRDGRGGGPRGGPGGPEN
jgi:hypothetical protein